MRVVFSKVFVIIIAAILIVIIIAGAVSKVGIAAEGEGEEALKASLMRAVASCYATEGYYPPSLQYITDNYGIIIDKEKYAVFYDVFAENIAPDITVITIKD